jgi:CMP-N,N'-diacetyllegionaminic acid synthase
MKAVAVIPARGGSKGLPRKNVLPLHGKPLIVWSIEQARAARGVARTIVSTDDEEIAGVARAAGAEVPFLRPAELATDGAATIDAVLHLLDNLDEDFEVCALLEPTSPLRKRGDIDRGLDLLRAHSADCDAVVSVGEVHLESPFVCKTVDEQGRVRPLLDGATFHQRQQLPKVWFPYGVLYAAKVTTLRAERTFYPPRTRALPIERWQNYEIDDELDRCIVEQIMRSMDPA